MADNPQKKEPIPYTAGDYDPGHTGRPPADQPDHLTRPPAESHGAGEGTQQGNEPEPYNKDSESN